MDADPVTLSHERLPPGPRRGHRRRQAGKATIALLVLCGVVTAFLFLVILDRTLVAPDWLKTRIEDGIERQLGGAQITFGDLDLVINRGWRPRVRLQQVELHDGSGAALMSLTDAEVSLAMRPLLRGRVQPKTIALTGAFATFRRDLEGQISFVLGPQTGPAADAAESLPQLLERWEAAFFAPALSALTQVELNAVTLRLEDAKANRIWTVDGGRVLLSRDGTNLRLSSSLSLLSGRSYASFVELNYNTELGNRAADFGVIVRDVSADDIALQSVALSWLQVLRAPISGALRGRFDEDGQLGLLNGTLQIGEGVVQPNDDARPIPFRSARSYFTVDPGTETIVFDELSVRSNWLSGEADGAAELNGLTEGNLRGLTGQLSFSKLSVNPATLFETPLELRDGVADFRLSLNPFRMDVGQLSLREGDSRLRVWGQLTAPAGGWNVALDGDLDRIEVDHLVSLWPEGLAAKPRKWVAQNLHAGQLSNLSLALRSRPGVPPEIFGDFDFSDTELTYVKWLPPLTGAAGQASLVQRRFVVTATSGEVIPDEGGAIDVAGSSFIIPDVGIPKAAPGVGRLIVDGPVTSILSMLDRPPLSALKDTILPVDMADGRARATGTLALPLRDKVPPEEIAYHFAGSVSDVESTVLVPNRTVRAEVLRVEGDQSGLRLSGQGQIDALPVSVEWRQPLGPGTRGQGSRLIGELAMSSQLLDTFDIDLPPETISGAAPARFDLTLGDGGPPKLLLQSDLKGAGLSLPQLDWRKPTGAAGRFELSGTLGTRPQIDRLELSAAGLTAIGRIDTTIDGGLDRFTLDTLRLEDWLETTGALIGRGRGLSPNVQVAEGVLDLRKATFGTDRADQAGLLQVSLDRLIVTDGITLTDFEGEFDPNGGISGGFRARLNGGTPVSGTLSPRPQGTALQLSSGNAGAAFRDAGLLKQAQDGDLELRLEPLGGRGRYDGSLRVTGTRVQDGPAVMAFLNSASIIGLFDELSGAGLQFGEVEARFRLEPDRITVFEGSAVGPSVGVSMDGIYDVGGGRFDMQGVISPLYLLNSVGSVMTRKGEGLIGFTFTLTGAPSDPQVSVNPLSALTPGVLREVFRGQPPRDATAAPPDRGTSRRNPELRNQPSDRR